MLTTLLNMKRMWRWLMDKAKASRILPETQDDPEAMEEIAEYGFCCPLERKVKRNKSIYLPKEVES